MREIKFRAWDKNDELMHDVIVMQRDEFIAVPEVGPNGWELKKRQLKNVELMQFTGLKDKNGTDIYEGDFVRLYLELPPNDETISHDVGKISWQFGCYEFCGDKHRGSIHAYDTSYLEVIGNVYENPELLNG